MREFEWFRYSSALSLYSMYIHRRIAADVMNSVYKTFAASEPDVEYELEEVWDGSQWHVIRKMVPKKTDQGIS